jgi:hypothetical protein
MSDKSPKRTHAYSSKRSESKKYAKVERRKRTKAKY